jgi:hypothetical protein
MMDEVIEHLREVAADMVSCNTNTLGYMLKEFKKPLNRSKFSFDDDQWQLYVYLRWLVDLDEKYKASLNGVLKDGFC